MLTRVAQLTMAVLGMWLLLRYGVVRVPGWGEPSNLQPVHWEWHTGPALLGVLCIAVALGVIFVRGE